jgi:hypothetical protein
MSDFVRHLAHAACLCSACLLRRYGNFPANWSGWQGIDLEEFL